MKLTSSRGQKFALIFPILNEMLSNKEFIAALAKQGWRVDTDFLRSLQVECFGKAHDLKLEYRKMGETMQTNGEVLDAKQFLLVIKQAFKASGKPSITQWAEALGVSYQFLSHVMRGDYNPGPAMAKALGYEQIYGFRRKPGISDIRTAAAALASAKVQPQGGKVKFVGKYRLARKGGFNPGASRRATKTAAAHPNRHHGKKTQTKKK